MIISLISVGENYNNKIDDALDFFKSYDICLLSDVIREDVFYYEKYEKKKFSYFDKLYFSLNMVEKFKRDVFYVDINKISEVNFDFEKTTQFYFKSYWPFGNHLKDYLQYEFFKPILEKWPDSDIGYEDLEAIRETELFFNKDMNVKCVIKQLEYIQPLFREMSSKTPTYPGYDNAEGIGLSYALKKCKLLNESNIC